MFNLLRKDVPVDAHTMRSNRSKKEQRGHQEGKCQKTA